MNRPGRRRARDYTLQTLRALDAVVVVVFADGEQVATFWDTDLDTAAVQAADFVGQHLTGLSPAADRLAEQPAPATRSSWRSGGTRTTSQARPKRSSR